MKRPPANHDLPPPADLVQATQDGEHPAIHAKRAEGRKAALRPATLTDLKVGAEVWYEVCAGGQFYKGKVEGPAEVLAGGILVPVRDMDPEYGASAIATPLSCLFVRLKETN